MTDSECLEWLHHAGSLAGRDAMLLNAYTPQRKLTKQCRAVASAEIEAAIKKLVEAKRITMPHPEMDYSAVAQFRWFSVDAPTGASNATYEMNRNGTRGAGEEGMYVFYQPLFELAMRSWFTNVSVAKGSKIVHAPDVEFDESVVGHRSNIAAFGGEHNEARVVRFIDAHTIELDRASEEDVKGYGAQFVPSDSDPNLCNCFY